MKDESILYPLVKAEEWAKRYSLSVESLPCENCGKMMHPSIAFAFDDWRGLMSKPHGCDEGYDLWYSTKATPAGRQEFINYFNILKGAFEDG